MHNHTQASHEEIDQMVIACLEAEGHARTNEVARFLSLHLAGRLAAVERFPNNRFRGAMQHADESFRRLRRRGIVRYDPRRGWAKAKSAAAPLNYQSL